MGTVTRAYDAVVDDVNKDDRTLVAKINTAGRDRYNTVIDPRGGKLENYRKNPAVLWEHGKDPRRHTDPIGRNVWIKHNGGTRPTELLARTRFLEDDFSQQRFEWYRDGTLNAFSVNILPVAEQCGPPTIEELRASPQWEGVDTIYRSWDLAEYSGTVIPGNADCLAERAAKMMELVSRQLLWLPDEVKPIVEAAASVAHPPPFSISNLRYLTHSDGKWIVHAEDGKVLGEHDSKESAEKQLAAVEAHKHDDKRSNSGLNSGLDKLSAPYIDTDGQTWSVYVDGARVATYPDARPAEEALRMMQAPPSMGGFERTLLTLMTEQRARDEERAEALIARIELEVFGRI